MANEEEVTDDLSKAPVENKPIANKLIENKSVENVENEPIETKDIDKELTTVKKGKDYSHLEQILSSNDDLLPESRLGNLDAKVLKKLGLTSNRMKTNDFLYFYQLILPICDTVRSGIN